MGLLDINPLQEQKEIERRIRSFKKKRTPRTKGTNPRSRGTNPRALGTNKRKLQYDKKLATEYGERISILKSFSRE